MEKTKRGIMLCSEWLHYCLGLGWKKKDLNALEELFWKARDGNGDMRANGP